MTKWELARYLIEAKKDIDTLMYIKDNQNLLSNLNLHKKIASTGQQFYIKCCVVLDKSFPKDKKKLCTNKEIENIYYERDKNSAHKDEKYKIQIFKPEEMITMLKKHLQTTREICKDFLPDVVTLDYIPYDRELFRFAYRVNPEIEEDIYKIKYPQSVFHSYQLSEEGQHYFKSIDTTKRDQEIAKSFGFDFEKVTKQQVSQNINNIRKMTNEEKQRQMIISIHGLNSYECLQNQQDLCIKCNLLHDNNIWVIPNKKEISKIEELKKIGFYDQFEIAHWEKMQSEDMQKKLQSIIEKYQ